MTTPPSDVQRWLDDGLRCYAQGRMSQALDAWARVLDVEPGHPIARQYVAYVRQVHQVDALLPPLPAADALARNASIDVSGVRARPHAPAPSPWDEVGGAGATIDLDARRAVTTPLEALLGRRPTPKPATVRARPGEPGAHAECTRLMDQARELFALGDFSGSMVRVEQVLALEPLHEDARTYLQRNAETLQKMYESKIGDLYVVPNLLLPPDEVIWINLHHKAGFVLSQVDGSLTFEDIVAVSGMPRFETLRILAELVQNGIIG